MQKKKLIILFPLLFVFTAQSQITKGNWLVGGNATFSYSSTNSDINPSKATILDLSPDVGYFFIDKLAGGVRATYHTQKTKYGPSTSLFNKFTYYIIGPFVRYYFLPIKKEYNIVTEINYQFGNDKVESSGTSPSNEYNNVFSFSAGPVIYLNSDVGIEFLLNYSSSGNNVSSGRANLFGINIGFQIHLQKEKN